MGLPFYFSEEHTALSVLEGNLAEDMTEEQIEAAFKASVICDGEAAYILQQRGYGHLLGVEVAPWDDTRISGECFDTDGAQACTAQKNPYSLTLKGATANSVNFVWDDGKAKLLSPAVTCFERHHGLFTAVFCGSPTALFKYTEGFAFLNESRKRQLVYLMARANALPVYYPGDEEICLRAGRLKDGSLLVCLYNLGYDPAEQLVLALQRTPKAAYLLQADGTEHPVAITAMGDGCFAFDVEVEPMYPVLLRLE